MKKRVLPVMLCILLVLSCAPTALAADDTTPPAMTGVTLNSTSLVRGDTLTVSVMATEQESGLDTAKCSVHFICQDPTDSEKTIDDFIVRLNTLIDGGIQGSIVLDKRRGGTFKLEALSLTDLRDNTSSYSGYDGNIPDVSFSLTSDYTPEPEPEPVLPTITGLEVSKSTAKVGDTITYTLTAADSSGVASANMQLQVPGASYWYIDRYNISLTPVAGKPGVFSGQFKITSSHPQADYYPCYMVVTSNKGIKSKTYMWCDVPDWSSTKILKVSNPGYTPQTPTLTSYSFSSKTLTQGKPVTITAVVAGAPALAFVDFDLYNKTVNKYVDYRFTLLPQGNNTYSCTQTIPLNMRDGDYVVSAIYGFNENQNGGGINFPMQGSEGSYSLAGSEFHVSPMVTFSGTDNRTLLVGTPFDPMAGVSATSASGDATSKIVMTGGNFSTNTPGAYLIKYKVTETASINGSVTTATYTDYRWIGITEIMPEAPAGNSQIPIAVTDESLTVGAGGSDVSLSKDGSRIAYVSVVNDPGEYTFSSTAGASSITSDSAAVLTSSTESASAGGSVNSVTAVIDRMAPAVTAAWGKSGKAISVSVKASDISGVSQLKYKAGSCGLDDCRDNGTAFSGSFVVPGYGAYTIYAKDKLGNEGVKVVMVSSSSTAFAYLSDVGVSGGTLSRGFSKTTYSYKITLGENEASVTLTPVKEWGGAAMTINGRAAESYTASLANGKSAKVSIKVKYGKTSKTYKFSITRAKSSNNNLSDLTATAGSFNTAFSPDVTNYTLALDENTASTSIRGVVQSPAAKASPASAKVTLKNGQSKTVKITVKAQSGARKTYFVTVTRAPSTSTALIFIKTDSPKYPLSPAFNADTANYTVTLPAEKGAVTLSAKAANRLTSVTVDGKKGSKKFALANGQSITVTVVVTAQSGAQREYTVTINRL